MRTSWQDLVTYSRNFRDHWLAYSVLFVSVDLVIQLLIIPLFRLVTTWVLQAGEIPFVSYMNIVTIVTKHPLVVVSLLVELLVLLLVVDIQFTVILLGIHDIAHHQISWSILWSQVKLVLGQLRPSSLLVLLGYFVLVIPFADLVFRTPLLSKVQIPEFILDFLTRNKWLLSALIIFYLIIIILAIRYLLTLPIMVYQIQRPRKALKQSWRLTAHAQWWPMIRTLLMLAIISAIITGIFYGCLYLFQCGLDHLPAPWDYWSAVLNLSFLQLGSELLTVWAGVVAVLIISAPVKAAPVLDQALRANGFSQRTVIAAIGVFSLIALTAISSNALYLQGNHGRRPVTVSHRGVAEKNGVQNTIPALKKTHRLHPDYVEMDLHETKDHQFVVMHDENLKQLTGVNKAPGQLTLHQITRLTARENGYHAKVASFDAYLSTAERLHQKLLVEIKPTPYDSKGMLADFNHRYGKRLVRDHDRVHSLDYSVVERLKAMNPRLYVMYVQPYNFTYPNTAANGYSMEYSTLTHDFIVQAHLQHKQVYAWTVNQSAVMKQEMYDNVDGIITDNLGELNQAINQYMDQRTCAARLANFIMIIPAPHSSTIEP